MVEEDLIVVETDARRVVTITLDRPAARNALSPGLVTQLHDAVQRVGRDSQTRAIVLTGAGSAFSAGGDIGALAEMATYSYEENLADSRTLDALFRAVDECPCPVVCRVNGAAFGGGAGLVACSDIAVAAQGAVFAFSEVRVGIIPAVISTYVVPRIGVAWSRRLLMTGERFNAERAMSIGLVHDVVPMEDLDATVAAVVDEVLKGWPEAQRRIKGHILSAFVSEPPERNAVAAASVVAAAAARTSDEGVRGLRAFLVQAAPRTEPGERS
jgi:methylglutaconyl-CoA hydratase